MPGSLLQRLARFADHRGRRDHLRHIEARTIAPHQRAERHVGNAGHRRQHDGHVDGHRTNGDGRKPAHDRYFENCLKNRQPLAEKGHAGKRPPCPPSGRAREPLCAGHDLSPKDRRADRRRRPGQPRRRRCAETISHHRGQGRAEPCARSDCGAWRDRRRLRGRRGRPAACRAHTAWRRSASGCRRGQPARVGARGAGGDRRGGRRGHRADPRCGAPFPARGGGGPAAGGSGGQRGRDSYPAGRRHAGARRWRDHGRNGGARAAASGADAAGFSLRHHPCRAPGLGRSARRDRRRADPARCRS